MFDLFGTDRLIEWKKFRTRLESSQTPFDDVLDFWARAPFVNPYLDPNNVKSWPDPWHLILDGKFDDLAISLGIAYTLKLTKRFMVEDFEIHMSITFKENNPKYYLRTNGAIFDVQCRSLICSELFPEDTKIIWSSKM